MKILDLEDKYIQPKKIIFQGKDVFINQYISYETKMYITNNIKVAYFSPSDDIEYSNTELKDALFKVFVLKFYTDIDFVDVDYLLIVNIAVQSGLFDEVTKNIPTSELETLKEMIDNSITEEKYRIQQENSIENQLKRFLTNLIEKIPDDKKIISMVKTLKKELNGFKPEKIKVLNDILKNIGGKEIPTKELIDNGIKTMEDTLIKKRINN